MNYSAFYSLKQSVEATSLFCFDVILQIIHNTSFYVLYDSASFPKFYFFMMPIKKGNYKQTHLTTQEICNHFTITAGYKLTSSFMLLFTFLFLLCVFFLSEFDGVDGLSEVWWCFKKFFFNYLFTGIDCVVKSCWSVKLLS